MIIVRYLLRETLKSQFAVFFVLFLIFLSQQFISVLADASAGDIPAGLIMSIVGLNMPSMGLLMLPLSLYIGILLTFGRLYAESEITVMNATGIGNKFLVQAALALALITGLLAAGNSLWLSPKTQDLVAEKIEQVSQSNTIDLIQKGQFHRFSDSGTVVFVDEINKKQLSHVFVAQPFKNEEMRPSVMFADSGVVKQFDDGRQVLTLKDGTRYEGDRATLDYEKTEYESYEAIIAQTQAKERERKWEAYPTKALLSDKNIEAKTELQWRLALVVCIPLLTLVVVPLSAVNPRQGRFAKLGPAVLIYLAYFLALSATKSMMEDGTVPIWSMWGINGLLLLTGIILNSLDSLPVRRLKDKYRKRV